MLQQGDKIELIAPSSGFSEEEYNSCLKIVEDMGLTASVASYQDLVDSSKQFVANDANVRFEQLEKALKSSESKAIWCMAGGYGAYHLLSFLDKIPAAVNKKTVIGFSDNSVLLNYLVGKWNWECIYGPTLLQIVRGEISQDAVANLKNALFESKYDNIELDPLNDTAKREGQVAGKMVGGCLSLLQTLIGTPQSLTGQGKIILLEDDKFETPGRIDRIFNHMLRAGFFDGSVAVVLGSFLEEEFAKNEQGFLAAVAALESGLDGKNIPLLKAENIGHCKEMITVPLGTFININLGASPVLKFGL